MLSSLARWTSMEHAFLISSNVFDEDCISLTWCRTPSTLIICWLTISVTHPNSEVHWFSGIFTMTLHIRPYLSPPPKYCINGAFKTNLIFVDLITSQLILWCHIVAVNHLRYGTQLLTLSFPLVHFLTEYTHTKNIKILHSCRELLK